MTTRRATMSVFIRRLLEQVVERLARAIAAAWRGGRFGFTLDRRPRLELSAGIQHVFRGDACRHGLLAFESGAGVEVDALGAGVQRGAAARAGAIGAPRDRHGELVAASRATHDLPEPRHAERLGRDWRLAAGRVLFLGCGLLLAPRLARLILVAALAVFSI